MVEGLAGGAVRIRSNVVLDRDSWHLIPGEIVERYRSDHFVLPNRPPRQQKDEKMYYKPCSRCHRTIDLIVLDGCNECGDAPSPDKARANRERHDALLQRVSEERARIRGDSQPDPPPRPLDDPGSYAVVVVRPL